MRAVHANQPGSNQGGSCCKPHKSVASLVRCVAWHKEPDVVCRGLVKWGIERWL